MTESELINLEREASKSGLLLRIQVRRPFNLWAFRLVVAENIAPEKVQIWGEMKGWAYNRINGLQLDTMRVNPKAPSGVGNLIWAATMAWALDSTPCKRARLLAILDDDHRHNLLFRYFLQRGFHVVREVGSSPVDLPFRMVWGGAGSLMTADCREVFERSSRLWHCSNSMNS